MTEIVAMQDAAGGVASAADRAAAVLRGGGVILAPTDTIYGFACLARDPFAVARVYTMKGRPETKPSLVLVGSASMAGSLASEVGAAAQRLMERCWPGPLTLLLKAAPGLPPAMTAGTGRIGVRLPAHEFSRRLVDRCGEPVLSTSANRSGEPPPGSPRDMAREFGALVDLVVDAGPAAGLASTIVDVSGETPVVVREGAFPASEITRALF